MGQAQSAGTSSKDPSKAIKQLAEKHARIDTSIWKILGVPEGASLDTLEEAHQRLVKDGSILPEIETSYAISKTPSMVTVYMNAHMAAERSRAAEKVRMGQTARHSPVDLHTRAQLFSTDSIEMNKTAACFSSGFSVKEYSASKARMAAESFRPSDATIIKHRRILAQKTIYLVELEKNAWEMLGFEPGFSFLVQTKETQAPAVFKLFAEKVEEIKASTKEARILDKTVEMYIFAIFQGVFWEIAKQWGNLKQEEARIAHFNTGSET